MTLLIVGAGGHAKVVVDAARAAGIEMTAVVGVPAEGTNDVLGVPVFATAQGLTADEFIVAIGDNRDRARLFAEHLAAGRRPVSVVHPSAIIADGVEVGRGSFIAAGVVVNVDTRIGENAILNTGCIVDHDCVIGDHAHIGPVSGLCGGALVGEGTLIGAGCTMIPLRSVGRWATLGAGSVVVRDIPDSVVYAGVPARPMIGGEE